MMMPKHMKTSHNFEETDKWHYQTDDNYIAKQFESTTHS